MKTQTLSKNRIHRWLGRSKLLLVSSLLFCFAFAPQTRAACDSPDPGCPGGNLAEGYLALGSLTSGVYNTGIGAYSLLSLTNSAFCTGVGAGTLFANTAEQNTATGAGALFSNTTGSFNTATGAFALLSNTEGNVNTAVGRSALFANTTGNANTAVGVSALQDNISGFQNAAIGGAALTNNIDGHDNTAIGQAALSNNTSGSNNIAIGLFAGSSVSTSNNVICIGNQGQNVSDSCFISNIFNATATGGSAVFIDANHKLGTLTSSKRFKERIKAMEEASEALYLLNPVTFRYKKEIDPAGTPQLGLVAEDVEKVSPDLVVRDQEGKPYSVRYDQVNAMLLNEFLKEHRKVEQLKEDFESKLAEQQRQIEALTSGLQKVSAQLEASKPAPQTVASNR